MECPRHRVNEKGLTRTKNVWGFYSEYAPDCTCEKQYEDKNRHRWFRALVQLEEWAAGLKRPKS